MAEVFLCAKGQLARQARIDLREAGIVVVEVDDPTKCQFIRSTETVTADDMLWAALDALKVEGSYGNKGEEQRNRLASNLFTVVVENRRARGQYVHDGA